MDNRAIIHVDMDAFFAAVEIRENPELKGKPVIVGGNPSERGVVATASYEARAFGIRSAMSCQEAYRRCPEAVFLAPRHELYSQVSQQIREIFYRYTPLVEPLSLDEAFLDVTGSIPLFGSAELIGARIQREIEGELNLTASVGVSSNKFLAKLASDMNKPKGFVVIDGQGLEVERFLSPLSVTKVWGIGKETAKQLQGIGIKTIGQLQRLSLDFLNNKFGKMGEQIYWLSRGVDHRPVKGVQQSKSIGKENTFSSDLVGFEVLKPELKSLCKAVGRSLRAEGLKGRTITLKIRFEDFKTVTRSYTFTQPTNSDKELYEVAEGLLNKNYKGESVRLLGVSISKLTGEEQQLALFSKQEVQESLDKTIDDLKKRFGGRIIRDGRELF